MKYAIGYDMGVGSLGWAAVKLDDETGEPLELMELGARIFSTSRDSKTNEPIAAVRRVARGTRRRIDRLKQRRLATLKQLVKHGLMPENMAEQKQLENLNPINIRAQAASERVSLHHLGRALFHLQQRRGYKSNRLQGSNAEGSNTDKAGERLRNKLNDANQTLGQLLATQASSRFRVNVKEEVDYPMRNIVEAEFVHMWQCQAQFYPETLTPQAHDAIWHAIFHQRKLKPQPKGKCYFNESEDRAIISLPTAQHYRILDKLHHIRIVGGAHQHAGIALTIAQKQTVYEALLKQKELTKAGLLKLLKLGEGEEINLFRGGVNSKILGNETNVEMRKSYGDGWDKLTL